MTMTPAPPDRRNSPPLVRVGDQIAQRRKEIAARLAELTDEIRRLHYEDARWASMQSAGGYDVPSAPNEPSV